MHYSSSSCLSLGRPTPTTGSGSWVYWEGRGGEGRGGKGTYAKSTALRTREFIGSTLLIWVHFAEENFHEFRGYVAVRENIICEYCIAYKVWLI